MLFFLSSVYRNKKFSKYFNKFSNLVAGSKQATLWAAASLFCSSHLDTGSSETNLWELHFALVPGIACQDPLLFMFASLCLRRIVRRG